MPVSSERRLPKDNTEPATTSEILTVGEVAVRLRVPKSWVYGHADSIGAFRVGKYLRFQWSRVLARLTKPELNTSSLGSQPNDLPEGH